MNLGLTAEQLERRRQYLCAGDAQMVLDGHWRLLWRRKKGLEPEDDLSGELRVQLGSFTEPFNLAWCERVTGREIAYYSDNDLMAEIWGHVSPSGYPAHRPELRVSEDYPFMACHLDGMTTTPQGEPCVIDAKHVARSDDAMVQRYTAAGTHQAIVMGVDWWALSVLTGNSKHEVIYQAVDPLFRARLIAQEREFWGYVERNEEPEDRGAAVAAPKPQPRRREVLLDVMPDAEKPNWSGEFARLARIFAETKAAADRHAIVRKELTELVPDDVGRVELGLVRFKRDGRGVHISLQKGGEDVA